MNSEGAVCSESLAWNSLPVDWLRFLDGHKLFTFFFFELGGVEKIGVFPPPS